MNCNQAIAGTAPRRMKSNRERDSSGTVGGSSRALQGRRRTREGVRAEGGRAVGGNRRDWACLPGQILNCLTRSPRALHGEQGWVMELVGVGGTTSTPPEWVDRPGGGTPGLQGSSGSAGPLDFGGSGSGKEEGGGEAAWAGKSERGEGVSTEEPDLRLDGEEGRTDIP